MLNQQEQEEALAALATNDIRTQARLAKKNRKPLDSADLARGLRDALTYFFNDTPQRIADALSRPDRERNILVEIEEEQIQSARENGGAAENAYAKGKN